MYPHTVTEEDTKCYADLYVTYSARLKSLRVLSLEASAFTAFLSVPLSWIQDKATPSLENAIQVPL